MNFTPIISIVIPTCNRNALLHACLDSLSPSTQTLNSSYYEVIVTDDSDENSAKKLIEDMFAWVKWVEGPKKGPAANRNNGAKHINGEWLVFIDDDCITNKNLLTNYRTAILCYQDILVFEGSIKPDRPQNNFTEESPINENGGCLWSCNFMIEKKLFEGKLKGFDEQFPYAAMEDVDLHYRLKKAGLDIKFLKDAYVIHPWRQQKNLIGTTLKRFKSTLYFLKKHPERNRDINSIYYLRIFFNSFVKNTLYKSFEYKFKGILMKIVYDFLHLGFSVYFLFKKNKLQ